MLIIRDNAGPFWLEGGKFAPEVPALKDVRVHVRPLTPAMTMAARDAAFAAFPAEKSGYDRFKFSQAFATAVAMLAIVEWEGFAGVDGSSLAADEAGIRSAMADVFFFDFFDHNYVYPSTTAREAEKNVSAPSQAGTSGAKTRAKRTVAPAQPAARTAQPS